MKNRLTKPKDKATEICRKFRYVIDRIIHERRIIMEKKITYRTNVIKAIEAIVWLATNKPNIDQYHVAKVLYYAEKDHLNKYARPIIGDTYIAMDYGQVPSKVRNLIKKDSWLNPNYLEILESCIDVSRDKYKNLTALRKPNLDYFSETDIECLELSLKKYGDLSFDELYKLSHEEKTWIETEADNPIDYLLMVDDDNPNKEEIIEEMVSNAAYARF